MHDTGGGNEVVYRISFNVEASQVQMRRIRQVVTVARGLTTGEVSARP